MSLRSSLPSMSELDVSKGIGILPKFDGTMFSLWKMQITAYLEFKDLLDVVESPVKGVPQSGLKFTSKSGGDGSASVTDVTEAKSAHEKDNVKKSMIAYNILLLSLNKEQLQMVIDVPRGNAHGVWSALLSRYERKTVASKMKLRNELHNIKLKSNENIDMYISRIKQLMLLLADMGSVLSNDESIYVLLKGLPDQYSAVIDTLSLNDKLEFEDACSYIRDRYERIHIIEEENDAHMDLISYVKDGRITSNKNGQSTNNNNDKVKGCHTCGKSGHMQYYCPENKDKVKCGYCRKIGHDEKSCFYKNTGKESQDTIHYMFALLDPEIENVVF